MKVILAIATSLDGRLTRGKETDINLWTSAEDKTFFKELLAQHNLILMGRKTYEAAAVKPNPNRLKIILTRNPVRFARRQVDAQLEFTSEAPEALVKRMEKAGYQTMLLVGGQVNTLFLKAGLIDEIYWTIEPLIFGSGNTLVPDELVETKLELISSEQLNTHGTLLLKYRVVK